MPVDPNTTYIVRGRILDAETVPLSSLTVEARDFDRIGQGQSLAVGMSGDDGAFELTFVQRAAGGRSEGAPEPYVEIRSSDGGLLHQTFWIALEDGQTTVDFGDITVDPAAPPRPISRARPGRAPSATDPSTSPGSAVFHGRVTRDVVAPRSPFFRGPFGRLFRELPPWVPLGATDADREALLARLAGAMLETTAEAKDPMRDNPGIPAAYTYFGQFVDHDITFDPTSSLTKLNDPDRLVNFRTPRFDLDSLYGEGPDDEPFLYDRARPGHFLLGKGPSDREKDLPRNEQETALIGDPRNDENVIVSQLQLALLRFHNRMMNHVEEAEGLHGREAFHRAQQLVQWHYQWVVLHDFLPRICGQATVQAVMMRNVGADPSEPPYTFDLRFYRPKESPFMPVEFSVAAYRFGHSMVRERYDLNESVGGLPIFVPPSQNPGPLSDLRGFRRLPRLWTLDWRLFLDFGTGTRTGSGVQLSRRIDSKLSHALGQIPAGPGVENPLALLNLRRGWRLELPSGQAVARAMGIEPIRDDQLGLDPAAFGTGVPLWYYILKEAEIVHGGGHLGPVGGRIVTEVFVGLAKGDPNCYLNQNPTWSPATATQAGSLVELHGAPFELRDIFRIAGLDGPPL